MKRPTRSNEVDQNANIIVGSTFDEKMEGSMRVSVVATGIDCEDVRADEVPSHQPMIRAVGGDAPVAGYDPAPIEAAAPVAVAEEATVQTVAVPAVARPVAATAAAVTQSVDTENPKEAEAPAAPALGDRNAAFVPPQPMPGKSQHAILRTQEPFAGARQTKTAADRAPAGRSEPSLFERITGTGRARNREQQAAAAASGHELLANYQMLPQGGGGFLRLVEIDGSAVRVRTYSPFLGEAKLGPDNDFQLALRP